MGTNLNFKQHKDLLMPDNLLMTLVPPARIEPAAHGLGNLPPSISGTSKDTLGKAKN